MHAPVKLVLIETKKKFVVAKYCLHINNVDIPQKINNGDRFRKYYPTLPKMEDVQFPQ
jgi:hypothetical protein